jgi:hypothetical protein
MSFTASGSAAISYCAAKEGAIFEELMADIADTARGYFTKEQKNLKAQCMEHRGQTSIGDAYLWVKKPRGDGDVVPANYGIMGLGGSRATTENLWGAFCQVKISLRSNDSLLSKALNKEAVTIFKDGVAQSGYGKTNTPLVAGRSGGIGDSTTATLTSNIDAYFSLGDAVMCGSWLKQSDLDIIEKALVYAGAKDADDRRDGANKYAGLIGAAVGLVGGGVGGWFAGEKIGGMIAEANTKEDKMAVDPDVKYAKEMLDSLNMEGFLQSARDDLGDTEEFQTVGNPAVRTPMKFIRTSNCKIHDGLKDVVGTIKVCKYTKDINGTVSWSAAHNELNKAEKDIALIRRQNDKNNNERIKKFEDGGKWIGMFGGAGLGSAIVGLSAQAIADEVHRQNMLKAGDERVKAWFDTVGSKIQCTVGGKVVGSYGDIIELK